MAAQAAAGEGLKVMLVESRGYLGGNLTIGLPILGFLGQKGNQIIEGLPQRFIDRLQERGAASGHRPCKLHVSLTIIDPEESKTLAQQLMEEAGVEVLMYVFCTDVIREGNEVKGVVIESKAGREAILARTVIDCTGDADVAFRAGVECRKGDAEGGMQPPTLMFSMRGVATQRLRDAIAEHPDIYDMDIMPAESFRNEKFITVGLCNQIAKAREAGIDLPVARTILITGMSEDEIWVNMSRVNGVDRPIPGVTLVGRSKPGSRFTESGNTCGSSSRGSKTRGWIGWHRSWVSARAASRSGNTSSRPRISWPADTSTTPLP